MVGRRCGPILVLALSVIFLSVVAHTAAAKDVPRMTTDQLKAMLGNPDVIVIDVRTEIDMKKSDVKIQGAVLEDPQEVESWMKKYPKDKTIVLYCA